MMPALGFDVYEQLINKPTWGYLETLKRGSEALNLP